MNRLLVSIVIPAYNSECYLDECLESMVRQTYPKLEIVLVDDGSKDSTPAICDGWAARDPRIKVVHTDNRGLPAARNLGLSLSEGEWAWFVDSDDILDVDSVEVLLGDALRSESDVVVMDIRPFDDSGDLDHGIVGRGFPTAGVSDGDCLLERVVGGEIGCFAVSMLVKAELLREFQGVGEPFVESFRFFEDIAFTHQLARQSPKVYFEGRRLYGYRQTPGSMVRKVNLDLAESGFESCSFVSRLPTDFHLFKRTILEEEPFPTGLLYEDMATTYRHAARCERIAYVDTPALYGYRENPSGISRRAYSHEKGSSAIAVTRRLKSDIDSWYPDLSDAASSRCFANLRTVFAQAEAAGSEDSDLFWEELSKYAPTVLSDGKARGRDRITALAARMGRGALSVFCRAMRRAGLMV